MKRIFMKISVHGKLCHCGAR